MKNNPRKKLKVPFRAPKCFIRRGGASASVLWRVPGRVIERISRKYNLKLVIIFGSYAKGGLHSGSDIDIAVYSEKKLGFERFFHLVSELQDIFPDYAIDLCDVTKVCPLLLQKISESGFLAFGKKRDFYLFKMRAFNRFCDYLPFFRIEEKSVKNFIHNYAC